MIQAVSLASNILMECMTMAEVQMSVQSGYQSVIVSSGSIEQHGKHLPLDTDYVLAKELAIRAAQRIGSTLVAPVIPIGYAEHHMKFPGTISVPKDVFILYVENVAHSLIRHGFRRLLLTSFHGGNFAPSFEAAKRIRHAHPLVDVRTALDLQRLFAVTNGTIREFFPDREELDCHAGCVETSMMLYLSRKYVRADQVENGAAFTEFPSFEDIQALSPNGVLGLTEGYSEKIGERLFVRIIDFMIASWGLSG